jgi:lincosamide nucleotidyltransferase A/C/D/E
MHWLSCVDQQYAQDFRHDAPVMSARQVAGLQVRSIERGVDWCIVGGWGVDALLRTVTREHKDLDVLLPLAALQVGMSLLAEEGFLLASTWPESRGIADHHPLLGEPVPSAFVLAHADGREIDIHIYHERGTQLVSLWDTDLALLSADLAATGAIDGVLVRCMTASMQLTCHQGYDLPAAHAADVRLLQQLVTRHPE